MLAYAKSRGEVELVGEPVGEDEDFPLIKRTNSPKTLTIKDPRLFRRVELADGTYKPGKYGTGGTAVELLESVEVKSKRFLGPVSLSGRFVWTQQNLEAEVEAGAVFFIKSRRFSLRALKGAGNQGHKALTSLLTKDYGTNEDASAELAEVLGGEVNSKFRYSKPASLIMTLLRAATANSKECTVLDSFAGSGTTMDAMFRLNAEDGGNRSAVLVELDPEISRTVTQPRLRNTVADRSRGFRYCRLGKTLLDEHGRVSADVPFADLARFVFLLETGVPAAGEPGGSPLIGTHAGKAVYLLYNGVLGDKHPGGGNVLTRAVLDALPPHPGGSDGGPRVVYGEACRLGAKALDAAGVTFRQMPYELRDE